MEGPQTRVLADLLHEALSANPVERILVPENRWQANMLLMNCVGQVIQRIRSHGRWIFFDFSHGVTWACHLIGKSAWYIGKKSEPESAGKKSSRLTPLIRIMLRNGQSATLTGRPLFLILPVEQISQHPQIRELGPDPLSEQFDPAVFTARLRSAAGRSLAAALTDEHIIAGIGNQMKCEILFAAKLFPATRVGDLYASEIEGLVEPIRSSMMLAYRHYSRESTDTEPLLSVYDRAGEPCRVCGQDILADRHAGDGRWTWYCPNCQKNTHPHTLFE